MRSKEKIARLYASAVNNVTNGAIYGNSKYTDAELNDLAVYVKSISDLSKRIEDIIFNSDNNNNTAIEEW